MTPGEQVRIRPARVTDHPRLVAIWRSAVEATHHFLATEHRDEIEARLAPEYFPHVELYVAEQDGVLVGFAGLAGQKLEMLFVDAAHRGSGVGSALLALVVAEHGVNEVDVNEQNTSAVEFYRRRGFVTSARSAVDGEGRPYPLLHMRLE